MTEIEKATAVITTLEDKRKELVQRATELADERNRIAFGAHVDGDAKARKRLDAINTELATMASEQASYEGAITEANARLAIAQADEALAADRAQAEQLKSALAEFKETGHEIDLAFQDLAAHAADLQKILDRIHQAGCSVPSSEQLRVLGEICARTALMKTPWSRAVEIVPPTQRRDFKSLIDGWAAQIENNIAARLGTKQEEAA